MVLFILFLSFFIFIGVLIGPTITNEKQNNKENESIKIMDENHSMHYNHDHTHFHDILNVDVKNSPKIKTFINKDINSGWNLYIETENFTFTPENVNGNHVENEGHAHVYIDGKKLTRLYGRHYYLSDLPSGNHIISVSLNTNNHFDYAVNNERIFSSVNIFQ